MEIITLDSGDTAGNANADFIVPAGIGAYRILYGKCILTTDATVANRQFLMGIYDDAGTPALIFDTHAGALVAASQTVDFEFLPGIYRETVVIDGSLQMPIPAKFSVRGGWTIRSKLSTGGQAGDSFRVVMAVEPIGSRAT